MTREEMITPDNPPAFPTLGNVRYNSDWQTEHGMTLRDWFAGQAVTGILANSENVAAGAEPTNSALSQRSFPLWLARNAYNVADAMLAERAIGGAA